MKYTKRSDDAYDKKHGIKEGSKKDIALDKKRGLNYHKKGSLKLTPVSKGHKPNGAHGRAAVKALGRTKTTGNFKKIEAKYGKGAAINAYQNALRAHKMGK